MQFSVVNIDAWCCTQPFPPYYRGYVDVVDNTAECLFGHGMGQETRLVTINIGMNSPARTTELICPSVRGTPKFRSML